MISAVTEKDISKLLPLTKYIDTIGKIADIIGIAEFIETFKNWNAKDKKSTEINIYIKTNNTSYMYSAIVDKQLCFKEMYSGYTGNVIKSGHPYYQININ